MGSQNILEKTILAGIGIYSVTKEKAEKVVKDLIRQGELSQEEGPKIVKAMVQKAEEEIVAVKGMVDTRVQQAVSAMKPSYENEFKKIHQRIDEIAKQLDKLSS